MGEYEAVKPGSRNPRYNEAIDMVQDMRRFERLLKSRKYPGLRIESRVIADEDHLTVAPAIITRGLLWALGASAGTAERRFAGAVSR